MSSPVKYCTKRQLGLQSDGVWRSGSVFAKNEVYKDSFGQVKIRQMFYSSRSASLSGEEKKNEIGLCMNR